jgi:phosphatidate phosphatase APP1
VLTTTLSVGTHTITLTVTDNNAVSSSDAVVITVNPGAARCVADVDDGSGTGTPDGGVTIDDLLYFLARLEAGC